MEQKKNAILLLYADSGIGLPTDQHELEKTGSLGLKLVRSIVENQFEGILKIENDNGAKFSIEIPIQNYHE